MHNSLLFYFLKNNNYVTLMFISYTLLVRYRNHHQTYIPSQQRSLLPSKCWQTYFRCRKPVHDCNITFRKMINHRIAREILTQLSKIFWTVKPVATKEAKAKSKKTFMISTLFTSKSWFYKKTNLKIYQVTAFKSVFNHWELRM